MLYPLSYRGTERIVANLWLSIFLGNYQKSARFSLPIDSGLGRGIRQYWNQVFGLMVYHIAGREAIQ
jgi:hypothetical protein